MAITSVDTLAEAGKLSSDILTYLPSGTNVAGLQVFLNGLVTSSFGKLVGPVETMVSGGITLNQDPLIPGFPYWTGCEGKDAYIGQLKSTHSVAGSIFLYDMLWGGTYSHLITTPQTVTNFTGLPTRAGTGKGCEIWQYTPTTPGLATNQTCTITYTNSDGVSGRTTTFAHTNANIAAGRIFQIPLQDGDDGIQSIQSIQNSAPLSSITDVVIFIMNRLCAFSSPVPSVQQSFDIFKLGLPKIADSSCLGFIHQGGTSSGVIYNRISILHG